MNVDEGPGAEYLAEFRSILEKAPLGEDGVLLPRIADSYPTYFCTDGVSVINTHILGRALEFLEETHAGRVICVVQNIDAHAIGILGSEYHIDVDFFVGHAANPPVRDIRRRDGGSSTFDNRAADEGSKYWTSIGYYELQGRSPEVGIGSNNVFQRGCSLHSDGVLKSNVNLSCCRVKTGFYLFLVDAPLTHEGRLGHHLQTSRLHKHELQFRYVEDSENIELPCDYVINFHNLPTTVNNFFKIFWQFDVLFHHRAVTLPSRSFLYLLAQFVWKRNLVELRNDIHRISFMDLREPNLAINNVLHDKREYLAQLRVKVSELMKSAPREDSATEWLDNGPFGSNKFDTLYGVLHVDELQTVLDEAAKLEVLLMDTFQLLMSSISILDSQASIEQTKRTTKLTQLAFIYIPLSFVTGVFGMNIQQLNGSGLQIWAFFVVLVVATGLTAIVFVGLDVIQRRRDGRADRRKKDSRSMA